MRRLSGPTGASSFCALSNVPIATVASAWVFPRSKMEDPCTTGITLVSAASWRSSRIPRPSILFLSSKIMSRITRELTHMNALPSSLLVNSSPSSVIESLISSVSSAILFPRVCLH